MLKRTTLRLIAAAAVLSMTACATTPPPADVVGLAARTPELSTLSRLITEAGLSETLRGAGPFTVFAPSNDAFKAVPAATMTKLAADKALLRSVLTYHALPGKVMAAGVKPGSAKSVQGANLALGKAGAFVTVEDAIVQTADMQATNGVVHIVDRVLMPPTK